MKFDLSDFVQLYTKTLLAVNGDSPCSGTTTGPTSNATDPTSRGSGGPGSSTTTESSKNGFYNKEGQTVDQIPSGGKFVTRDGETKKTFTYDNPNGKGTNTVTYAQNKDGSWTVVSNHYYNCSGSSYGSSSTGSGSGACGDYSSSSTKSGTGSTGKTNGGTGSTTTTTTGSGTCGGTSTGGTTTPTIPGDVTSGGGTCSGGSSSGGSTGDPDSTSTSGGTTETTQDKNALIQERLFRAIKKVGPHSYDIADETNPNEYRCDEYVADILERGGFNVYDYCVDDPVEKSVDDHYHDMLNKKLEMITDRNDLEQGASYILVMRDQDGILDSHIGLYINGGENGYCYVDNSGSNYGNLGGTETHKGANISEVLADYHNYEYMYFVKLQ